MQKRNCVYVVLKGMKGVTKASKASTHSIEIKKCKTRLFLNVQMKIKFSNLAYYSYINWYSIALRQ